MFKNRFLKFLEEKGLTSLQAKNNYYLYKSVYISAHIAYDAVSFKYNTFYHTLILGTLGIGLTVKAYSLNNNNDTKNSIIILIMASIIAALEVLIFIKDIKISKLDETKRKEIADKNTEKIKLLKNKIQKFWLLNGKVISRKMWRKIKKVSPQSYNDLRSGKLTGHCYVTTWYMLSILRDKELKMMWILNTDYGENSHKYGHAVIKKGNYIYCPNQRRTYDAKKYLESNESQVFLEMTLSQYMNIDNSNNINEWLDNPKSIKPNKFMSENFGRFNVFCIENGGFRSIEDKEEIN